MRAWPASHSVENPVRDRPLNVVEDFPVIRNAEVLGQARQRVDLLVERQAAGIIREETREDIETTVAVFHPAVVPEAETAIGADAAEILALERDTRLCAVEEAILTRHQVS